MELTEVSKNKMFGGWQKVFSHKSRELGCDMKFGVYLPPQCESGTARPALFYLSGLTCTEQNFVTKACAQRAAAERGLVLVAPDTSPRGCGIAGEDESYDFGSGAGFYVDATREPWSRNYRMHSYVTKELMRVVADNFPVDASRVGVTGHSMGGHGALICALRNPGLFASVSALAPICNPTQCQWGQKAFAGYFGEEDKSAWSEHDATCLAERYDGPALEILIDQGEADEFLAKGQLLPDNFVAACRRNPKLNPKLRMQQGYDHSYFFIASFMGDHVEHHAERLTARP